MIVLQIVTEKPQHYNFTPGQATEISINKNGWKNEKRPFTFTCLPDNDVLEFTIKTYPLHKGVTNELLVLKKDNVLILHDVFGAIAYKGEGLFIAGGAGVTPFICIIRYLQSKMKQGTTNSSLPTKRQYIKRGKKYLIKQYPEWPGQNILKLNPNVRLHTVIMHGKKDKICSFDLAEQMKIEISNSYIVTFEKSGHSMFLEETKKFNAALIKFALP